MAVKIRLRRIGAKKQPAYRIVVADARAPRDGRFIEVIGHYNPLTEPATVEINSDRAVYWLRNGAQPTEAVQRMMERTGVWSAFTGQPMPESAAPQPEAPVAEEPAPEPEEVEDQPVAEKGADAEETVEAEETAKEE